MTIMVMAQVATATMAEAAMASLTVQAGLYSLWGSGAGGGMMEDESLDPGAMKKGGGKRAR